MSWHKQGKPSMHVTLMSLRFLAKSLQLCDAHLILDNVTLSPSITAHAALLLVSSAMRV